MRLIAALILCTGTAHAELALTCIGDGDWRLDLPGNATARLLRDGVTTDFEIPHSVSAAGQDYPLALTLIAPRDSAIFLIEPPTDGIYPARLLTQDGTLPVLLTGTCTP